MIKGPTLKAKYVLSKAAVATDAHWGAKANSELHNQDCMRYFEWFCDNVRADPSITHVNFLGDWFETRSAINISTLNYAYRGAQMLNDLGLPVFFIVGNHDLYHRHTREVHSITPYSELCNFVIIDKPTVVDLGNEQALYSPYLFHEEYQSLHQYDDLPTWWGHFEFRGFVVTGHNITMTSGPDPNQYTKPKRIFSGHFHKRQTTGNVTYVGNIFPTNFSDAGDNERGMMVYDHKKDKVSFIDWDDCPKYTKTKLTAILDGKVKIHPNSRVKCVVDVPISFQESTSLRQKMITDHNLREFSMEESREKDEALSDTETEVNVETDDSTEIGTVDEMVIQMLSEISSELIDNQLLIEQYKRLTI